MRLVRTVLMIVFVFAFFAAGRVVLAQQDQTQTSDPVAEAARKAREQKKSASKPKKVFTDDDIAPKPATETTAPSTQTTNPDASPAAPGAAAVSTDKDADAPGAKEDVNSEAYWRKRFAAQRKKIADAEQELEVLQREVEKAGVQYYSDPQKALNEQYSRKEISEKNEKILAKKQAITDMKQQLSEMEDELRQTGGDPGWAR